MPDGLRKRKYFVNTFKGNWKKTHKYTHTNTSFNLLCYLLIQAYIDDKNQVSIQLFPNSFTKVLVTLSFLKKSSVIGQKKRISKQVLKENKACQIFQKTNISYPLIRTRTCVYHGVRNFHFSENLACFVFLKQPF